jgi:hypothetical protein
MKESNRDFDEDFIRISLQNREFFLIIGVWFVTAVSTMPFSLGHRSCIWHGLRHNTGYGERTNCRRGCSFSFFVTKALYRERQGQSRRAEKNVP